MRVFSLLGRGVVNGPPLVDHEEKPLVLSCHNPPAGVRPAHSHRVGYILARAGHLCSRNLALYSFPKEHHFFPSQYLNDHEK